MPINIRDDVFLEYYGKILTKNKIMKLNFSENSIKAISLLMKEITLGPNDYLFK
jgi:hypothetical protein